MSKIDEKYINALGQFTDALEQIVDILKSQQKAGKADTVNEFLKTPMDNLVTVVADLKKVTQKGFADLKSDNQEILKKIESIKQQKESGMFDRVEDPRNKNKIVDGIKVVILIAAGVLALGMAFKIIGKVDFLSVIALSTAMLVMSHAFSKIVDFKNLTYGQVFKVSSILPIMALGLALSAYFLRDFPTFTLKQGLSLLFIGGGLGVATFLLLKAVSKVPITSLLLVPLLPIILPIIAWSLVKASMILTGIQSLSLKQVVAVAAVGVSIGIAMFAVGLALKHIKNVRWQELLLLPVVVPLIAWGIVKASNIFQEMQSLKDPIGVVKNSLAIGLSILAFVPAVYFLGKLKFEDITQGLIAVALFPAIIVDASQTFKDFTKLQSPLDLLIGSFVMGLSILAFAPAVYILGRMKLKDMLTGALAIPVISGAILASAWIFQFLPDAMKYPSIEWTLGAGLSVLAFGGMAVGLGLLFTATGGLGALGMAGALLAILAVAGTIVSTSYILASGDYSKYPPLDWALGVGGSLLAFSLSAIAASVAGIAGAVASLFTGGEDPLLKITKSIVSISTEIQKGNYSGNYPSKDWSEGVGLALIGFATATVIATGAGLASKIIGFFTGDSDPLLTLTKSIVSVSTEIQKGNYSGNYPSVEWAAGVGLVLAEFAALKVILSGADFASKLLSFFSKGDPLLNLTKSIVNVSTEIQKGNYGDNYPSMEWASSVGIVLAEFAALKVISSGADFASKILTFFSKGDPLVGLAKSVVGVSTELNSVDWTTMKYPSKEYSEGVGIFLTKMAEVYSSLNDIGFFGLLGKLLGDNQNLTEFTKSASNSIVEASKILANGNFTVEIKKDYVDNFAYFITSMSKIVDDTDFDLDDINNFAISSLMLQPIISNWIRSISQGDYNKYPTAEYTKNLISFLRNFDELISDWDSSIKDFIIFSIGIKNIVESIEILSKVKPIPGGTTKGFIEFVNNLKALPELPGLDSKAESIHKLAMSFATLADSLSKVNSNLQNFGTLSRNLPLINIDDSKLLENIDKYKGSLSVVNETQTSQANLLTSLKDVFDSKNKNIELKSEIDKKDTSKVEESKRQQQFYQDIADIRSLLYEFKDFIEAPSQNGSFYK